MRCGSGSGRRTSTIWRDRRAASPARQGSPPTGRRRPCRRRARRSREGGLALRRLAPPHLEPGDVHVWRMRLPRACPDVVGCPSRAARRVHGPATGFDPVRARKPWKAEAARSTSLFERRPHPRARALRRGARHRGRGRCRADRSRAGQPARCGRIHVGGSVGAPSHVPRRRAGTRVLPPLDSSRGTAQGERHAVVRRVVGNRRRGGHAARAGGYASPASARRMPLQSQAKAARVPCAPSNRREGSPYAQRSLIEAGSEALPLATSQRTKSPSSHACDRLAPQLEREAIRRAPRYVTALRVAGALRGPAGQARGQVMAGEGIREAGHAKGSSRSSSACRDEESSR